MRHIVPSICLAFALGACTPSAPVLQPGQSIPSSPTAGPGSQILSAFDAGVIFADTCLIRGPNFGDAVEGLRVHNVTRNTATGTYYHDTANLSVRVTPEQCSMVYATSQGVDVAVAQLASGSASILGDRPSPPGIAVTSQVAPDGLRYFRLGIQSPVQ